MLQVAVSVLARRREDPPVAANASDGGAGGAPPSPWARQRREEEGAPPGALAAAAAAAPGGSEEGPAARLLREVGSWISTSAEEVYDAGASGHLFHLAVGGARTGSGAMMGIAVVVLAAVLASCLLIAARNPGTGHGGRGPTPQAQQNRGSFGTTPKGFSTPPVAGSPSPTPSLVTLRAREALRGGKKNGAGSPAPSPRTLAQMSVPRASITDRKMQLCDPSAWSHIEAYFTIQANQLYDVADSEATGTVDILRGGPLEPVFLASVLPWDNSPRALLISSSNHMGQPLCSCAPAGALGLSSGGFCSELELRDAAGRAWGILAPIGADAYCVSMHVGKQVLTMQGDQSSGRLIVRSGEEVVAHAAMDGEGMQLEVGVKQHTDPVLMLTCVLAVLIFNPEGHTDEDGRRSL